MKMLFVKAAPGLHVSYEHQYRRYITETNVVSVPDSAYYRRLLTQGDLVLVNKKAKHKGQ
ncbi:hypothetical protein [Providencia alcalifaciens]|uniref:hypothetical protein n=1 Tax=Providencia alcalifaciens TaxID=126385 RepID=UPI0003E29689|nr:hypothetical protein [Providencia alcalifaciens]ETS98967.1 hypothetical protein HMPREF1568_3148 [Providencia alcalifaciens PAL-3]EUC99307.1 hypothetical protein HMPREF1566_0523 [Providencia alcalifaciens PAL-1]MTC21330.1 DUF2635 domain-containing protein [Providencia sp. wls1938]ETT05613.1 hypothetical protein HMPREF1562_1947 [Providencia alcalifaciens F90-2004]MTC22135.1 DUF2635 domain-containing protein [Providencia sp. wls1938]